jgi:hypothetical protein
MRALPIFAITLTTFAFALSNMAQTVIPTALFRSVELRSGGHVVVRHGSAQRVTIITGDRECTRLVVDDSERLVIDNHHHDCSHDSRLRIEVVTPEISSVAVSNGGTLQAIGAFPVQSLIEAHVEQGGTIDIRSIAADSVNASVYSGGRIFTNPRETLDASVASGGIVSYWGDARVRKSIRGGGVVTRGARADAEKPLSDLAPHLPDIPPVPPIPPIPALPRDSLR